MSPRATRDQWADVFSCLASPARLLLIERLLRGPVRCGDLQEVVGLSQPATSYHLAKLERAGILQKEKRGTMNCYRVDPAIARLLATCMKGDGSWNTM